MKQFIKSVTALSLILFPTICFSQTPHIEETTYTAKVQMLCKTFRDGGCEINTYHALKFEKDSVVVGSFTQANCQPADRNAFFEDAETIGKYGYTIQKKKDSQNYLIRIDGYKYYLLEIISPEELEALNINEEILFKKEKHNQ